VPDQVLGVFGAFAGLAGQVAVLVPELAGDVAVLVAEPVAGLLGEVAHGLGGRRDPRRPTRGQLAEELLDRLTAFAGLLLDLADELVNVSVVDLEVVVGQLTTSASPDRGGCSTDLEALEH